MKKDKFYKKYFLRLFFILVLFGLLYRILLPSLIWLHSLFFFIRLFGFKIDYILESYYTLATGLLCCFLSEILINLFKIAYLKFKNYKTGRCLNVN